MKRSLKVFICILFAIIVNELSFGQAPFRRDYYNQYATIPRGMEPCKDKGFLLFGEYTVGSNLEGMIIKVDSTGDIEWTKSIEGAGRQSVFDMLEISNGYLYCGMTEDYGAGGEDLIFGKMDFSGSVLWTKTYGSLSSEYARYMVLFNDSTVGISGYTGVGAGANDFFYLRVDLQGNQISQGVWGNSANDFPEHIVSHDGVNLFIGGYRRDYFSIPHRAWIGKIDANANLLWQNQFGNSTDLFSITSLTVSNNGELFGVGCYGGSAYFTQPNEIFVSKFTNQGNIDRIWGFSGTNFDYPRYVNMDTNGDLLIFGDTRSFGGNDRAFILKCDSIGNILFQREFETGTRTSYRDGLNLLPNGNIAVLVGSYSGLSLAVLDPFGDLPNCALDTFKFSKVSVSIQEFGSNFNYASEIWGIPANPSIGPFGINDTISCCEQPIPNFVISGCPNDTSYFVSSSLNSLGGAIYIWDFEGDGIWDDTTYGGSSSHYYGQSGSYFPTLLVINPCGKSGIISIPFAFIVTQILPLGNDTTICQGDSIDFSIGPPIGGNIIWDDGSTNSDRTISGQGSYWYTIVDSNGCLFSDTIVISEIELGEIELGPDTNVCGRFRKYLSVNLDNFNHLWSTGETAETIMVQDSGTYYVVSSNQCQVLSDTIHITSNGFGVGPFIPNVFTPNGDGINDEFEIKPADPNNFHLWIYDRWGGLLFESFNPSDHWKGLRLDKTVPEGVYIYRLDIRNCAGELDQMVGNVTVLR